MTERYEQGTPEFIAANRLIDTTPRKKLDPKINSSAVVIGKCHAWLTALKRTDRIHLPTLFQKVREELGLELRQQRYFFQVLAESKDPEVLGKIVHCIYHHKLVKQPKAQDKRLMSEHEEFYGAMLQFLGIQQDTRAKTADAVTGTYQLWRHSTSTPGYYVKGIVEIGQDATSSAVRVRMLQCSEPKEPDNQHLRKGAKQWNEGYIFRRSGEKHYVMMLTDDRTHPELNRGGLRLAIFRSISHWPLQAGPNGKSKTPILTVFSMEGFVLGIDESRTIFSPVYMERVSNNFPGIQLYLDELGEHTQFGPNLYTKEETPPRILAILGRHSESVIRD